MKLISVNTGKEATIRISDRIKTTGIYKRPVTGPAWILFPGVEGDFIASKKHHGGPDQAIYIYGSVDYDWWKVEAGLDWSPGMFGENLTIEGLESSSFNIGDQILLGTVVLEISAPRIPCETFANRMGDEQFVKRFRKAERPGLYCRVLEEGIVQSGDEIFLRSYQGETVALLDLFRNYYNKQATPEALKRILRAPIAIRARVDFKARLERMEDQ